MQHGAPHTETQAERVVANWFNLLAMHLMRLWRDAGIDPHRADSQGCVTMYAGAD